MSAHTPECAHVFRFREARGHEPHGESTTLRYYTCCRCGGCWDEEDPELVDLMTREQVCR
jgi:hypothetical protein